MGFLKTLLLAVGLAYGQQPNPQALIGAPYRDFSGGYIDYVAPSNLQPNQSPNLLNVKIDDPPGSLSPRQGYVQCGITPSGLPPTVLYEYTSNSGGGVPKFIVSDSSNAWQTSDCVTYVLISSRLAGGSLPSITTVRDKVWIVNRSTYVITWNGTNEGLLDGRANTPVPTVPRFNYIEFWNERVWGARTNANPSGIYFSDLTDTLGNDLDPSTGTLAWPADNIIQIAQENGSPIYGIKVYRNALFAFKSNGIWRVDFNGPFDIAVVKTLSTVGTRYQASIVEHDGLLYFLGIDGFYSFDGDKATRISDGFKNKFNDINQTSVNTQQKTWDTQADFLGGTFSSTTANDIVGSVTLSSQNAIIGLSGFESGGLGTWTCIPGTGVTRLEACGPYSSTDSTKNTSAGPIGTYSARVRGNTTYGSDNAGVMTIFKVDGTTVTTDASLASGGADTLSTKTVDSSAYVGQTVFVHIYSGSSNAGSAATTHLYSPAFVAGSAITFQYSNAANVSGYIGLFVFENLQSLIYYSSGVWTSDAYNLVAVSTYSTFDADSATNGGTIDYSIRVGTSASAILNKAYAPINPGSLISGTSADIFVQVKATFTAIASLDATPELQNISVNTVNGSGSSQSVYSFSFMGNLYITVSTGSATSNNLVFVKSRLPLDSWTLYDWQLGPMARFNDRFYAGSSTASWVSRMNYGTNDQGKAISWFWESREDTFDRPNIRKYLMEMNLDYRKGTEEALTAGYSRDEGASYTTKSVSAVGSGRGTARLFMAGSNSLDYRFKVSGSTLDGTVTVLGLTGWVRPAILRE